jgi:hypothetical protein
MGGLIHFKRRIYRNCPITRMSSSFLRNRPMRGINPFVFTKDPKIVAAAI